MARLLTDEHFPDDIVNRLRLLGHDVVRVRDLAESKSGDGLPDEAILSFAMSQNRIVLTYNVSDFKSLHNRTPWHKGIIACSTSRKKEKPKSIAKRIDRILKSRQSMTGAFERLFSEP